MQAELGSSPLTCRWASVSPASQRRVEKRHSQGQQQAGLLISPCLRRASNKQSEQRKQRPILPGVRARGFFEAAGWGWGCQSARCWTLAGGGRGGFQALGRIVFWGQSEPRGSKCFHCKRTLSNPRGQVIFLANNT